MGSIVINGTTINDLASATLPTAGTYYPTEDGMFGGPPCAGPIISARSEIAFAGLNWSGEKDFGKRKRIIYVDLVWFATLLNIHGAVQTNLDAWITNTRYTITLNGVAYAGCKLYPQGVTKARRVWNGGGLVGHAASLVFMQLSDTN